MSAALSDTASTSLADWPGAAIRAARAHACRRPARNRYRPGRRRDHGAGARPMRRAGTPPMPRAGTRPMPAALAWIAVDGLTYPFNTLRGTTLRGTAALSPRDLIWVHAGRIDPGVTAGPPPRAAPLCAPRPDTALPPGPTPLFPALSRARHAGTRLPPANRAQAVAGRYSERCWGMPASKARTSVSRYRRCPPSVLMDVSFPALAHLVTVLGSTRNIVATSAGVSSGSASGVRADIWTASPPGPVLRSCVSYVPGSIRSLPWMSYMVYCYHIAITSGDKATTRSRSFLPCPRCPR